MTDEHRISELRNDLNLLHSQVTNQYTLLREISSILGTVSSTLMSASQISAHERESLISRLEMINTEIATERRELDSVLSRIERSIEVIGREFGLYARDREEVDGKIADIHRHTEAIASHVQSIHPSVGETLRHARKLVERDPDTGAEVSKSDKVIKTLTATFWAAIATAAVLLGLSKLIPWVRGIQIP